MSFKAAFSSRLRSLFASRGVVFRAVCFVLSGALAFFALSLASSAVRYFYAGVARDHFVQPLHKVIKARSETKQRALAERDAAKKDALRQTLRQAGSLASPYVEVGEDMFFPLLVRVWLNVDPSHTARVANNDERFPLVYERAVSAEGFVPVVGLTFGDNSFDIDIRDANGERVAQHSLTALIEDTDDIQGGIEVRKKAAHNDFVSAAIAWGAGPSALQDSVKTMYYGVIDDFGDVRWLHQRKGISSPWVVFGVLFDRRIFLTYGAHRIFATDIFGNKEVVFDGKKASHNRGDYYIHHDYTFTDKGTMLMLANPISKKREWLSYDNTIVEVDSNSGKMIREIDVKESLGDIFDVAAGPKIEDYALISDWKKDWMHLNSIAYDAASKTIVLSGRNQSAVFALDYETGALVWMFADPEGLTKQQRVRFLEAPEGYVFHKGQHDAQLDGNRLRFFDNAVLVKRKDGSYTDPETTPSRIVEATLDLANKKITEVKTYAPKSIFAKITSGIDVRNGKYLVCYCGIMKDAFGGYVTDSRNDKGPVVEVELFEFGNDGSELLHVSIRKGLGFRPRYFDWKEMVEAK